MRKKKFSPVRIIFYLVLILFLIYQLYPIIWMIITSLKSPADVQRSSPFSFPDPIFTENYINAIKKADLLLYFRNSAVVTIITMVLVILFSSTAGFALEKLRFKAHGAVLSYFLTGITIPIHITLIPLFIIYKSVGMLDTWFSLILPQIGFCLPLSIYLFTAFYRYIPNSMLEAAIIDGASVPRSFFSIYFPLSKNTIMTVATVNFISVWNEFVFANTFTLSTSMRTIPVGLKDFGGEYGKVDWGCTFAAIALTLLPLLILYFVFNKSIISGMTAGAIKE